jgi:hypothetical protein
MTSRPGLIAALAVPALVIAPAAAAEEGDKPARMVMIGTGPQLAPDYPGAASSGIGPFPVVNIWRENEPFPVETPDEAKGIKLIRAARPQMRPPGSIQSASGWRPGYMSRAMSPRTCDCAARRATGSADTRRRSAILRLISSGAVRTSASW